MTETYVCKTAELPRGARQLVKVGSRNIAVYNARGNFYAIDNACYHHGGPLLNGDIEDVGGHPCVVCPWHSYRISLSTGEGFYMGVEVGANGKTTQCLKSKGVKQRTHRVDVRGDSIFVVVDTAGPKIESDTYAEMALANKEAGGGRVVPGGGGSTGPGLHSGYQRSGHVLGGRVPFGANVTTSPLASNSQQAVVTVKCIKVVPASANEQCKTFVFEKVDGKSVPRLEPGMYVTLGLPKDGVENGTADDSGDGGSAATAAAAAATFVKRTWTVSSIRGDLGGWFAITVKLLWPPEGRGGSAWLHQHGLGATLPVLEVGGDFTVSKLRTPINARRGAVLMLSAGIGITPLFASVHRALSDPFTTVSGPPLHIVHVHVDRTLDAVPLLAPLAEYHQNFSGKVPGTDPASYSLHLFLTRDASPPATGPTSPPPFSVVAGSRPTGQNLRELMTARFGALGVAPTTAEGALNVTVMLCGPQQFMDGMRETLVGIGVDRNNVVCEAFDF